MRALLAAGLVVVAVTHGFVPSPGRPVQKRRTELSRLLSPSFHASMRPVKKRQHRASVSMHMSRSPEKRGSAIPRVGIVGLSGTGKSTLFRFMTRSARPSDVDDLRNSGQCAKLDMPPAREEAVLQSYVEQPSKLKIRNPQVQLVDVNASLQDMAARRSRRQLETLNSCDALLLVVDCREAESVESQLEELQEWMGLVDELTVRRRVRLSSGKSFYYGDEFTGPRRKSEAVVELKGLRKLEAALQVNGTAATAILSEEEGIAARQHCAVLTRKPFVYVANTVEDKWALAGAAPGAVLVQEQAQRAGVPVVFASAATQLELQRMEAEERDECLALLGQEQLGFQSLQEAVQAALASKTVRVMAANQDMLDPSFSESAVTTHLLKAGTTVDQLAEMKVKLGAKASSQPQQLDRAYWAPLAAFSQQQGSGAGGAEADEAQDIDTVEWQRMRLADSDSVLQEDMVIHMTFKNAKMKSLKQLTKVQKVVGPPRLGTTKKVKKHFKKSDERGKTKGQPKSNTQLEQLARKNQRKKWVG